MFYFFIYWSIFHPTIPWSERVYKGWILIVPNMPLMVINVKHVFCIADAWRIVYSCMAMLLSMLLLHIWYSYPLWAIQTHHYSYYNFTALIFIWLRFVCSSNGCISLAHLTLLTLSAMRDDANTANLYIRKYCVYLKHAIEKFDSICTVLTSKFCRLLLLFKCDK